MIDIRSDTVTMPTPAMRRAMAQAPVGDDVYGDDPTVNELEALAARMLGKEAGLFMPSGTMSNQAAIMAHTQRGDELIASPDAHIVAHEVGGPAVLSGVMVRALAFRHGIYDADSIEAAIRSADIHEPPTGLIALENALSNGRVMGLDVMESIYAVAKRHALPVHLDGARVFNAAVALQVDVKEITRYTDTVSCCLSKGLCAPAGAVLAGPERFIHRARKCRKLLGGGMRQAGILAAAGLIALKEMPGRLHEDHENAKHMARLLSQIEGVSVDRSAVDINMVFFSLDRPVRVLNALERCMLDEGVKINGHEGGRFRFVTNKDVSREDVETAVQALRRIID